MARAERLWRIAPALLALMLLKGCLWWDEGPAPASPAEVELTLEAALDTNRDINGRPSPVIVRVLQLRSDQGMPQAELFQSQEQAGQALGSDLLGHEAFFLRPGEHRFSRFAPVAGAQFIAVVAEYRDIDHAQWWASTALAPNRLTRLTAAIRREQVELSAAPWEEAADE